MKTVRLYLTILILGGISSTINAQWLWDINKLNDIKQNIHTPAYSTAYKQLLIDADKALKVNPYSVTFKEYMAPSGDKHDYVSLSRYAWPNTETADGLPYKLRDGESNPELEKYDRHPLGNMASAVNTLALAYFYSGKEYYAAKAVELIRAWFFNEETKMNPNLNYAQFMPGVNQSKGRAAGLIDSYSFVSMLNSVKLLDSSESYTSSDDNRLKEWFANFAIWWQTSEQGIAENNSKNNHGLAYDVQLVVYLLFSGNVDDAKKIIDSFPEKRLYTQIEPDGKQPQELRRTLAFHYSEYNIRHMIEMFFIAKSLGIDLYKAESADGRNFYKAIDFLTPYLGKGVSEWPYKQISGWENTLQAFCEDLYCIVALDSSRKDYLDLYKKYGNKSSSQRSRLLFGALDQ